MKPVVADSGPLISFVRIRQLNLVQRTYPNIIIPPAVAREITPKGKRGAEALRSASWIQVTELRSRRSLEAVSPMLGVGEREAIALAHEQDCKLLIDDLEGRQEAAKLGVHTIGSVGLLLEAKEQGLIPKVKPLLDALLKEGFRLSSELYRSILQRANESAKRP